MMFALLLFAAAAAVVRGDEAASYYCCQSENSNDAVCAFGGCQYAVANLASFYSVRDCRQCAAGGLQNSSIASATFNTTCSYCSLSGDHCAQESLLSAQFGCSQSDSSRPLVQFEVTRLASGAPLDQSFCCYYRAANASASEAANAVYQLQSGAGGCPYGNSGLALVAFAEHTFAFDCPARPPCEADCHGNGLCAGSQCVCKAHYFGDACDTRCDSSNCVMGVCYNDPHRTTTAPASTTAVPSTPDTSTLDARAALVGGGGNSSAGPAPSLACHCARNVVGQLCDKCAVNFEGPNCLNYCVGAPCVGAFMTGKCKGGSCECARGYSYDQASGQCACSNALCRTFGACSANGTCDCAGHWNGTSCSECACANGAQCSAKGACICPPGFAGDSCDKCATDFYNTAANCTTFCLDYTTVNITFVGNDTFYPDGMCHHNGLCNATTGACDCPPHALGAKCETCADGYFGLTCGQFCDRNATCGGLGTCNNATGLCDCFKSGFGGNCTTCKTDFYPAGVCTVQCNAATTCNYNGHCSEQGACVCSNDIIYQAGNCAVQIWVIIVPCLVVLLIFAGFVFYLWKKKKATDEFGEPLLGGGGW